MTETGVFSSGSGVWREQRTYLHDHVELRAGEGVEEGAHGGGEQLLQRWPLADEPVIGGSGGQLTD